jgi:hypothetical protein
MIDELEHITSLRTELLRLAHSTPANPRRVEQVMARARRRERRLQTARVSVGAASFAATVAVLGVAVAHRNSGDGVVPGAPTDSLATPTSTESPTTSIVCPDDSTKIVNDSIPASPEEAAKKAAAAAAAGRTEANGTDGIKGFATVGEVTDTSIGLTFDVAEDGTSPDVVAVVDQDTEYYDNTEQLSSRPPLTAGDRVVAATTHTSDGDRLLLLEVNPPDQAAAENTAQPKESGGDVQAVDATKRAIAAACGQG